VSIIAEDKERRVVPRWRYTTDHLYSAEFTGDPRAKNPQIINASFLEAKLNTWNRTKTAGNAIDILCAHQCGSKTPEANVAAKFLLEHANEMTPQVVSLARKTLGLSIVDQSIASNEAGSLISNANAIASQNVREIRHRLRHDLRNSLAWLDLCRSYTILGFDDKAERCMRNAIFLTPNHRHIIRAAVRFYLHIGQKERAHHLLTSNRRTPKDPWLTAAELAVAQVMEINPRFSRKGRQMVDSSGLPPAHLSELKSALGMLDLYSGAHRKAKQLFRASLEAPTENAVAQARWVGARLPGIEISEEAFALPKNHEARTWQALSETRWDDALQECVAWFNDEPFSSRSALVGSFIGLTLTNDPELAKQFAKLGIKASPDDALLHNNLTIALAYLGELDDSLDTFKAIPLPLPEGITPHVYVATAGLLKFRIGDATGGRELYDIAEKLATKLDVHTVRLFRLREELNSNPTTARSLLENFELPLSAQKDQYAKRLLTLLKAQLAPSLQNHTPQNKIDDIPLLERLDELLHRKGSPL